MTARKHVPDPTAARDRPLSLFARLARMVERQVGRSATFALAVAVVIVWAASGPFFQWSDTWQLVINTGTTIVTFLMVFVIQNTQSRDTQALHLKLDELIRVNAEARDSLVGVEELSDSDISDARAIVQELAVTEAVAVKLPTEKLPVGKSRKPRNQLRTNGAKPAAKRATAPAQ
jgi:low affinity Fe/Cu permease